MQLTDKIIGVILDEVPSDNGYIYFLSLEDLMWKQVKVFDFSIEDLKEEE